MMLAPYIPSAADIGKEPGQRPMIRLPEARDLALRANAFERSSLFVELWPHMVKAHWLRVLGEFWPVTDGDRRQLIALLRRCDDWREMMGRSDGDEWDRLPARFVAWRGCYAGINEDGVSFTLNRDVARQFPSLARYRISGGVPVLLRVMVERMDCVVKLDLSDSTDIIVRKAEVLSRVRLPTRFGRQPCPAPDCPMRSTTPAPTGHA